MALFAEEKVRPASTGTGNFPKYSGYFEGTVVGINPTAEEYFDIYQREATEKSLNYLETEPDGTAKCNVVVHIQDVKTKNIFQIWFKLRDVKKIAKTGSKYFINTIGDSACASSEDTLNQYFLKDGRDYRQAYDGEIEFVHFLKTWLGKLDFKKEEAVLQLDWKKVISGNLKEWKDLIGHEWTITVGALAAISVYDSPDGPRSSQKIFNKAFFPGYSIRNLRMVDLTNTTVLAGIANKKGPWPWEKFVKNVISESGGCRWIYEFKELSLYDPENSPENGKVISTDGADY